MKTDFKQVTREILGRLNLRAEAELLGLRFAAERPSSSGWIAAYAFDRDDRSASASFCVSGDGSTGAYVDHGGLEPGRKLSFFDLAARLGNFGDWKTARDHFAAKVGVRLPGAKKTGNNVKAPPALMAPGGVSRVAAS